MKYRVLPFTLVITSVLVMADDCPYKECSCSGIYIYCSYNNFSNIPQMQPYNTTFSRALYFDGDLFTTIPAKSLPANLSNFGLDSTPVESIDDTAFDDSLYTLQDVSFSQVRFTKIPEALFQLKSLTSLYVNEMNVTDWNDNGMKYLGTTLQELDIYLIYLPAWPTWLNSMTNLSALTVSQCSIFSVPDDGLDAMAKTITYLNLASNNLTTLPKSMSNLVLLNTLTLTSNRITDITWLPRSKQLIALYLNGNKISDAQKLSNGLSSYSNSLKTCVIDTNSLTSIPDMSLLIYVTNINIGSNRLINSNSGSFPSNTTDINMDNNLLVSIPSTMTNLKNVIDLSFSNNNIQSLQGSRIPVSAQSLDLTSNSITELTKSSFPINSSLKYLTLNGNPLSLISLDAFTNLNALGDIGMEDTMLTRMPLALASLKSLNYISISSRKKLVCTCQEQSLYGWVMERGLYAIDGDCGVTSIYQFYLNLSPACPHLEKIFKIC